MLQQTQVDRVVPYFERFVEQFPSVEDLAAASIEDVLAIWSGLGYYRRARLLHAAARQIVATGAFPLEIGGWRELPGIGPYSAAAIVSIAFGRKVAAIDVNVERVLSRHRAIAGDIKNARGRRLLSEHAETFLDRERPGDSNQALMELGAMVCRPRNPDCPSCPLVEDCVASRQGTVHSYPAPTASKQMVKKRHLAVVVEKTGKVLLFRRPADAALLAGLWEVPSIPWVDDPQVASAQLSALYGGNWELQRSCGWIRHSITHRDIRLEVWRGRMWTASEVAEGVVAGWFESREIGDLAVSSLVVKSLRCARVDES